MPVPILINCRDRVSSLLELIGWLEAAGHQEIYLLDNDSIYEPLLDYYRSTPHTVLRLGANYGRLAPWVAPGVIDRTSGRSFVFTDPDIVPVAECPLDAVAHFAELLERFPAIAKAGFGLRIDDLPDHYVHKRDVVALAAHVLAQAGRARRLPRPDRHDVRALSAERAAARGRGQGPGPPYVARHTSTSTSMPRWTRPSISSGPSTTPSLAHTSHWIRAELPTGLQAAIDEVRDPGLSLRYKRVKEAARWRLRDRAALQAALRRPRTTGKAPRDDCRLRC